MVVRIPVNGGPPGPTGEFHRPGQGANEPGSKTHTIIPNRNAQVTVPGVVPMYSIDSVAKLRQAEHLMSTGATGGEVVMGTGLIVTPRTNAEWIAKYEGPEFGRNYEDQFAGTSVPMWYPQAQPSPVEDRGGA